VTPQVEYKEAADASEAVGVAGLEAPPLREVEPISEDTPVRSNPTIARKSSFLAPRPFDPNRPVQFPIKRPNFSPGIIHPVPAVSRRFGQMNGRAPEVRGFASLPSNDDDTDKSDKSQPPPPPPPPPAPKQTTLIRNQLIQSAKRPSGQELHPLNPDHTEPIEESNEEKPAPPRPFSMPVSSSLLLAATRNGTPSPPPPPIPDVDPVGILSMKKASLTPVDARVRGGRPQSLPPKFESKPDPREQLLQSIRDFGLKNQLKQTRANFN